LGQAFEHTWLEPGQADGAGFQALMAPFETLRAAGAASASDWSLAAHLALRHWRFDQLAAWQQSPAGRQHVGDIPLPRALRPLPAGQVAGWWAWQSEEQALVETAALARAPTELWVVFHPQCGPCRRMQAAVSASAPLQSLMDRCGRWVAQMDARFNPREFTQWAQQAGQAPVQFRRAWAGTGVPAPRATPVMLVMREGRHVQTVIGWPREGREAELMAAVRAADAEGRCVPR
jgi:hypothetical protein